MDFKHLEPLNKINSGTGILPVKPVNHGLEGRAAKKALFVRGILSIGFGI